MPHIDLPPGLPGIVGPMTKYAETEKALNALVHVLLRGENTLSEADREMIAAYVSEGNDCYFCANAHGYTARHLLGEDANLVDEVNRDPETASISPKMKSLLAIAARVRESGSMVTKANIERAKAEGATDKEIHDTVLIAATFCMLNRYVDGLATWTPRDEPVYKQIGAMLATVGYRESIKR